MTSFELSAYFSHPWRSHLALNLAIWERLKSACHLLLDRPIQRIHELKPPYYINRMESLLTRSDVFVSCLPLAELQTKRTSKRDGDWAIRCSPYILFEVRMAERADLPRFVVYDPRTGFRPPDNPGPHARYVPARLDELTQRLEHGGNSVVLSTLEEWIGWVAKMISPHVERDLFRAAYLVTGNQRLTNVISQSVKKSGFDAPLNLANTYSNDAELTQQLRTLRLLIVDVSNNKLLPLYQMAHALMVPCIRLHKSSIKGTDRGLPLLLRGHPAGYQDDLLSYGDLEQLGEGVRLRSGAVVEDASPITSYELGRYELQQRGYKKHSIFVSHNMKGDDRVLVDAILHEFRQLGLDFWEYEDRNQAGEDWTKNLDGALNQMTHFVALETYNYDQSVMCVHEMKRAKEREATENISIRAFRVADRASPAVELRNESRTHQPLPVSPEAAALLIANNLSRDIRR